MEITIPKMINTDYTILEAYTFWFNTQQRNNTINWGTMTPLIALIHLVCFAQGDYLNWVPHSDQIGKIVTALQCVFALDNQCLLQWALMTKNYLRLYDSHLPRSLGLLCFLILFTKGAMLTKLDLFIGCLLRQNNKGLFGCPIVTMFSVNPRISNRMWTTDITILFVRQ